MEGTHIYTHTHTHTLVLEVVTAGLTWRKLKVNLETETERVISFFVTPTSKTAKK